MLWIFISSDLTTEEAYKMQLAVSNHYWYQVMLIHSL